MSEFKGEATPPLHALELIGPIHGTARCPVVLNGWSIPLIDARENDGGTVSILVDGRIEYTVPAGEAENVLRLVADVIAVAWGYWAHPSPERWKEFHRREVAFARVPHPTLAPIKMVAITTVEVDEVPPSGEGTPQ